MAPAPVRIKPVPCAGAPQPAFASPPPPMFVGRCMTLVQGHAAQVRIVLKLSLLPSPTVPTFSWTSSRPTVSLAFIIWRGTSFSQRPLLPWSPSLSRRTSYRSREGSASESHAVLWGEAGHPSMTSGRGSGAERDKSAPDAHRGYPDALGIKRTYSEGVHPSL
ncbi:hypothetical protein BJV78DRAFT_1185882 [Lactifluus subvellereus]|nr:hypothetical protein BJV78DRAFT_1185882 [Lactifluus subvellereus]